MNHVLKPIKEPFALEIGEILTTYPQRNGYILKLFRVFANSRRFLKKGVPNLLDRESPLSMREREIVILRVTANRNCEYEWGVHVGAFAEHVKFTPEQIRATRLESANAPCWPPGEGFLIRVVDEICERADLSGDTLEKFQSAWSLDQQLEIIALCGAYHTISFVANIARIEGEDFGAKFPV
ncbi:MAG: carboxymuconolactone decarboxylase [Sneathiella sp.]|uniref:carboxymuconolactone decarboxylase family protein n=1 Tax=Sneathiella sp. TaxID=1964365 RepID=UPI000C395217|nr:carboxymuconolactone decarboxylase family protein [Sneathiella sp.]MAZ03427.1 carboxymuconolactone decarboxylase [Sneathiella sp.]